jgi:hypothetical protein
MAGLGDERRFRGVRDASGLPSTPEALRRRSEPRLWAITGRSSGKVQQNCGMPSRTSNRLGGRAMDLVGPLRKLPHC